MAHSNFMNTGLAGFCADMVAAMPDVIFQNNPTTLGYHTGTLDALMSRNFQNSNLINVDPEGDGSVKRFRVEYFPRPLSSGYVTSAANACNAGTERNKLTDTCIVDNYVQSDRDRISEQTLQQYCEGAEGPQRFIQKRVLPLLMQARKGLNDEVLTDLNANCIGVNINNLVSAVPSAAAKSIDVLDADCNPIAKGLATIAEDYDDHMLGGEMAVVGQGNFAMYSRLQGIACCNDGGVNVGGAGREFANFAYYKDTAANGILGDNNIAVIAPGSVKLVTFNENRGEFQKVGDTFAHLSIPDPFHEGLMWDFEWEYTACEKVWDFRVSVHWNLCCWPSDVFNAGDDLENVTGAFLYTAAQLP